MRKKTVRGGLRLLNAAVALLMVGTFYSVQASALFALSRYETVEFVRLTLFWGGILGGAAIIMIAVGLLRSSQPDDRVRIMPSLIFLMVMIALFFSLFYHSLASPPTYQPLRPGEVLII